MNYEEKYNDALERAKLFQEKYGGDYAGYIFPELSESEDERIRKWILEKVQGYAASGIPCSDEIKMADKAIDYLEKQKENPKSADSISADCTSDAKCEDRWHKVGDFLPDNGRLVLANDCLGNTLLARYDGEGNWEVSVYDNEDYYCRNTITKWCEIPSEKQKPVDYDHEMWKNCEANFEGGKKEVIEHPEKYGLQKPAEWSEEDEKMLERAIHIIVEYSDIDEEESEIVQNWLKSLRPSWKPSEVHLSALLAIFNDPNNIGSQTCQLALTDLYEQLKKL